MVGSYLWLVVEPYVVQQCCLNEFTIENKHYSKTKRID